MTEYGLQLYSVRDITKDNLDEALGKVAALGYKFVEFAGFFGNSAAALAVDAGLDVEEGWRAITINPANLTGIGDRVGSLEVGKDADVVIWTANPMTTVGAHAYMTLIDGNIIYRED